MPLGQVSSVPVLRTIHETWPSRILLLVHANVEELEAICAVSRYVNSIDVVFLKK